MCGSRAVVFDLSMHQNHLEVLLKYSVSKLVGIGLGLIIYIFNNFPSDSDLAGPGSALLRNTALK